MKGIQMKNDNREAVSRPRRARRVLSYLVFVILLANLFLPSSVWASEYDSYRPKTEQSQDDGFSKLQALNPDVLGWISIYGTRIDYPFLQSQDNKKYLDHNATGDYAITGSIFLDYRCNPDFRDFNTIIYGHHVGSGVMFGDIKKFADPTFFENHKYGSIYYDGKERGLEIFGILEVDAYDTNIYRSSVSGETDANAYYQYLMSKAKYKRNVQVTANDKIVLLSTCFVDVTNGRHILLAKVTDKIPANTASLVSSAQEPVFLRYLMAIPLWVLYIIILVLFILVLILLVLILILILQDKKARKNEKF